MAWGRRLLMEQLETRELFAVNVAPTLETASTSGADDIAIWIHPTDTSLSTVIGTAKTSSNSLRVFNLAGELIQSVSVPNVNNIDLRYNFPLNGKPTTILAGSNRASDSIVLYRVDPQTRMLESIAARSISTDISIYGCAMYVSPTTGKYYVIVSSESGQIQQWELFDDGAGQVDAKLARSFSVGSISEGIVADDEHGKLYIGEENVGIWKYSAEPSDGTERTLVDSTGNSGHLDSDVEGLAIYYGSNGAGYLIASSQGADEFDVYQRGENHAYLGSFSLVASGSIDAVTSTDGIDVTNFPLGSQFPQGMFVAQDNDSNFKLVRWNAISAALGDLPNDTSWDPRKVGASPQAPALPGDFNRNDSVDAADYTVWRGSMGTHVEAYSGADANGDGIVNQADYEIWKLNFGRSRTEEASVRSMGANAESVDISHQVIAIASIGLAQVSQPNAPESRFLYTTTKNRDFQTRDALITSIPNSSMDPRPLAERADFRRRDTQSRQSPHSQLRTRELDYFFDNFLDWTEEQVRRWFTRL